MPSGQSVNLLDGLKKGIVRTIIIKGASNYIRPSSYTIWIILGGALTHITGTASTFNVHALVGGSVKVLQSLKVAAASASGSYNLYSSAANAAEDGALSSPAWTPLLLNDETQLNFDGDATAYMTLQVLEYMP